MSSADEIQHINFCEGRQEDEKSTTEEVEKLLERIRDGLLPEDRREALELLSEILQSNGQVSITPKPRGFKIHAKGKHA